MRVQLSSLCYSGALDVGSIGSLLATIDALRGAGHHVAQPHFRTRCAHTVARAMILHQFMRGGADVLVSFDSGVAWRAADVVAAVEAIEQHGADVVGLPVPERDGRPNVRLDQTEYDARRLRGHKQGAHKWLVGKHVIGGALHVVSQRAALRLVEANPDAIVQGTELPAGLYPMGVDRGAFLPEDFAFFRRWIALGETWVQASARVQHDGRLVAYDDALLEWGIAVEWQDGAVSAVEPRDAEDMRRQRADRMREAALMSIEAQIAQGRPRPWPHW